MRVSNEIVVGNISFSSINDVVYFGYRNQPSQLTFNILNKELYNKINVGDRIVYRRGYDNKNFTRFVGNVSSISKTYPYQVVAYDILYFIMNNFIDISQFLNFSSQNLISKIFNDNGINTNISSTLILPSFKSFFGNNKLIDILNTLSFNNNVLDYYFSDSRFLNENINLLEGKERAEFISQSYNKDTLYFGEPFSKVNLHNLSKAKITRNMVVFGEMNINNINAKEIKIRLIIKSSDNSKKTEYLEQGNGKELISFDVYDMDLSIAQQLAIKLYNYFMNIKYTGDLTIFGLPIIFPSEKINLELANGTFAILDVESVKETIGEGIRQNIKLRQEND